MTEQPVRAAPLATVASPADWRGAALQDRPEAWLHRLAETEIKELARAIAQIRPALDGHRPLAAVNLPLPALAPTMAHWLDQLDRGPGVVLVRGLPLDRWSREDATLAYWLIGRLLGDPVPQNAEGDLLVDVRDDGASAANHNTRRYRTRAELAFHTDGADIIGLLCLRAARAGGVSRICSSVHVYQQIVRRRPDLAPLLFTPYHHHAHGQFGPDGPRTFQYPIVTLGDGTFRMFLLSWYIRHAAEDFPDVARLTPQQLELLDLLESIPLEDGVALDMSFQPGDMQFLKNSVVLHARTAYEDFEEPDARRHLVRLWLSARQFQDGDDFLRRGIDATRRA